MSWRPTRLRTQPHGQLALLHRLLVLLLEDGVEAPGQPQLLLQYHRGLLLPQ